MRTLRDFLIERIEQKEADVARHQKNGEFYMALRRSIELGELAELLRDLGATFILSKTLHGLM